MKYGKDDLVCPVLVWSEKDYERAVSISDDEMPETFPLWQEQFRNVLRSIPAGAFIVKIKGDPDEIAEWCKVNGLKVEAKNRARWAVERFMADNDVGQD